MSITQEIQELKTRLAELEEKAKQEASDHPQIVYGNLGDGSGCMRYSIRSSEFNGEFLWVADQEYEGESWKYSFRTSRDAEDWADALNVMMECRRFAGAFRCGEIIWCIRTKSGDKGLKAGWTEEVVDCCTLLGAYPSKEAAQKAIDTVGEERIIKAMKTLACVGE